MPYRVNPHESVIVEPFNDGAQGEAMKVHHINGGSMRFPSGRFYDGEPGYRRRAELVCHCLAIETASGLVLVDTGLGTNAITRPATWLGPGASLLLRPPRSAELTAVGQLKKLGFAPEDVRHIVLTHLDADHAGGLADFPHATVHLHAAEHEAAMRRRSLREKITYRHVQYAHGPRWATYAETGEPWFGFDAVRQLDGLPSEVLMIPLAGHTRGHTGVAVDTETGWILHAGDAYFHHGEADPAGPHRPPGIALHSVMWQVERKPRVDNLRRLLQLARDHRDQITMFCAHSAHELRQLQAAASGQATERESN